MFSVFSQGPGLHSLLLLKRWVLCAHTLVVTGKRLHRSILSLGPTSTVPSFPTRTGCPLPWVSSSPTPRHTCTPSDSKVQMLQLISVLLQVSFQVTWGVMGCVHPVIESMVVKPIPKHRGALSTCGCAWGLPPRSLLPIL